MYGDFSRFRRRAQRPRPANGAQLCSLLLLDFQHRAELPGHIVHLLLPLTPTPTPLGPARGPSTCAEWRQGRAAARPFSKQALAAPPGILGPVSVRQSGSSAQSRRPSSGAGSAATRVDTHAGRQNTVRCGECHVRRQCRALPGEGPALRGGTRHAAALHAFQQDRSQELAGRGPACAQLAAVQAAPGSGPLRGSLTHARPPRRRAANRCVMPS